MVLLFTYFPIQGKKEGHLSSHPSTLNLTASKLYARFASFQRNDYLGGLFFYLDFSIIGSSSYQLAVPSKRTSHCSFCWTNNLDEPVR